MFKILRSCEIVDIYGYGYDIYELKAQINRQIVTDLKDPNNAGD